LKQSSKKNQLTRRALFGTVGKAAAASVVLPPLVKSAIVSVGETEPMNAPVAASAGVDRITVLGSKTYLHGWAGYGEAPVMGRPQAQNLAQNPPAQVNYAGQSGQATAAPAPAGPTPTGMWSKESGPGTVTFADPKALTTTATFSALGTYALKLTVTDGESTHSSTLHVSVEAPPPARQLEAVYTKNFKISSPFWNARAKTLIVNWIPHCIDQINRTDLTVGQGGIDNFINAGKALRGEPHGYHKGYVFSNAWVHQTVEAMSIALMIDPQGDPDILKAHEKFHQTLDAWIPIILAAQEPDGYLQTAFTAAAPRRGPLPPVPVTKPDGTVVLARVTVSQDPDGTLHANRGGGRGGQGQGQGQVQTSAEQPFDGKTSTTVLFPVLNQDGTTTPIRIALTEGAAPAAGRRGGGGPNAVPITASKIIGSNPDGKPDTTIEVPTPQPANLKHWDPATRGNHEGYTAGYFLESAINHYLMTEKQDARLYSAAKKLADCWYNNLGPAPKKPWYDGHEQMEQGLVRFGRFVNDMEGNGQGQRYIELAKWLLDCRSTTAVQRTRPDGTVVDERSEYDQSHLPVVQQYEVVGHAVRAMYLDSGMADVAVETHDLEYHSAVKSLWDNLVNKKLYVTGGVGSGDTAEGFGVNYALSNQAYCEACSSCGEIFFHWKMHLAYHHAKYADLIEETMYNALLGANDLEGKNYYYDNPLDENKVRYAWHVCPCCVGNIPRTLLMMPTWVYTKSPDSVYVNLFVGSTITVENVGGTDVEMVQATEYPWKGNVAITVNPKTAKNFSLRIRVPDRGVSKLYTPTPEANGVTSLHVNGAAVKPAIENGYAVIARNWKAGDKVELVLPMTAQRVYPDDRIAARARGGQVSHPDEGKVALKYGPLIYNIEKVDQDIAKPIDKTAPLTAEWRPGLLGGVMVIKGKFADGSDLLAIPNYARTNRDGAATAIPQGGGLEGPRPLSSVVWIKEG
jgi:DUF1680 family protein